ncbi:DNA endonuclease SmrA [Vibrio sp. A11]|nr:DNA endonuclease SmrA [Vibrio sp. V33_P6A3T137]NNN61490.1 DNA endonuclease SmrA [Vibrio sp. A11]
MMPNDDLELFQQMMDDVKPLAHDVAQLNKPHTITEAQLAKRQAAITLSTQEPDYLSIDCAAMLKPDDIIEYKKAGIQDGVYKKLRLGKYPLQARLDLHRKTLKQARDEVIHFIAQCIKMDLRTVLIVHGRGERSTPQALMKSFVASWLTQIDEVQCAHSAQRFHGGSGAVYLLLKKSKNQKSENRERHQKRLG